MLQPEDFEMLQSLTDEKVKQLASELSLRHNKKLNNLEIKVNDQYITTRKKEKPAINLANEIFNYSNRTLNYIEASVLNKGLKFGIKAKKNNSFEIILRFELLAQTNHLKRKRTLKMLKTSVRKHLHLSSRNE